MPRLLTVATHLGAVGGTELAQLRICRALAQRGWEIDLLYVSRGDLWSSWRDVARRLTKVPTTLPERNALLTSATGTAVAAVAGWWDAPDAVYVHRAGDAIVGYAIAAARACRLVTHLHLPPPIRQPRAVNSLLRRAGAVITPSADTKERWVAVAGLPPSAVEVIPTGIDTDEIVPADEDTRHAVRSEIGAPRDVPMVLYAGRLDRSKGLEHLLAAGDLLSRPIHLVVCGSSTHGADDGRWLAWLRTRPTGNLSVAWMDRRPDVVRLMAAADLVVLPSTLPETQALVLAESMSAGTPVVASAVGGVPELLGTQFSSQLVRPGDAGALAAALDRHIGWRVADPSLGARSRAHIREHLDIRVTSGVITGTCGCTIGSGARRTFLTE